MSLRRPLEHRRRSRRCSSSSEPPGTKQRQRRRPMFRLDGKAALITGASGGIGAAIARALHLQGASVVLSGTREPALAALAAELGDRAHVCPADLNDPAAPDGLVVAAEAAAG